MARRSRAIHHKTREPSLDHSLETQYGPHRQSKGVQPAVAASVLADSSIFPPIPVIAGSDGTARFADDLSSSLLGRLLFLPQFFELFTLLSGEDFAEKFIRRLIDLFELRLFLIVGKRS